MCSLDEPCLLLNFSRSVDLSLSRTIGGSWGSKRHVSYCTGPLKKYGDNAPNSEYERTH